MSELIVIVTGSRHCEAGTVWKALSKLKPTCVIPGACPTGADHETDQWALKFIGNDRIIRYHADWDTYGKPAGHIRNGKMLRENLNADFVLAFPRDIGNSGPGTKDCMEQAKGLGFLVLVVEKP